MAWSTTILLARFSLPQNRLVLDYLVRNHPSAHSDVVTEMLLAAEGIADKGGKDWFCPDPQQFAYCLLHTSGGVVFALAVGMSTLAFRLPEELREEALAEGAQAFPELGEEWLSFYPFDPETPTEVIRKRLARFCRAAYEHATSLDTGP